jgi:hypothetical protein
MNYLSGERVKLGDVLQLWDGCQGVVVCSIDDGEYSAKYPIADWSYLKSGILIDSDKAGLIHCIQPESSFELLRRASK